MVFASIRETPTRHQHQFYRSLLLGKSGLLQIKYEYFLPSPQLWVLAIIRRHCPRAGAGVRITITTADVWQYGGSLPISRDAICSYTPRTANTIFSEPKGHPFIFFIPKGGPFGSEKQFLLCGGVNFAKKKFCISGNLSNGLRILVHLNFDMTHLSPPSTRIIIIKYDNNVKQDNLSFVNGMVLKSHVWK